MSESLPENGLLPMELPSMSSAAGSRAKTSVRQALAAASQMALAVAYGQRSPALWASYDRGSQSWRTSQVCFVARQNGRELGLAEFSGTWPNSGMMRSGKTYPRRPWAILIAESASGLLPTPTAQDWKRRGPSSQQQGITNVLLPNGGSLMPNALERLMGFPDGWTEPAPLETP